MDFTRFKSKVFRFLLLFTIITMLLYIITGYFSSNHISGGIILARILSFFIIEWEYLLIWYLSMAFVNEANEKEFINKNKKIYIIGSIVLFIVNVVLSIAFSSSVINLS